MKIGKFPSIFLSIILFFNLSFLVANSMTRIFPGFDFSDNQLIRIILLALVFILTNKFYTYIYGDLEKDENDKVHYGANDLNRKIAILFVIVILFVIIGAMLYL